MRLIQTLQQEDTHAYLDLVKRRLVAQFPRRWAALLMILSVPTAALGDTFLRFLAFPVVSAAGFLHLWLVWNIFSQIFSMYRHEMAQRPNREMFTLTALDTRVMVWGKWAAIVRAYWRAFLLIGVTYTVLSLPTRAVFGVPSEIGLQPLNLIAMLLILPGWMLLQLGFLSAISVLVANGLSSDGNRAAIYVLVVTTTVFTLLSAFTAFAFYTINYRPEWFGTTAYISVRDGLLVSMLMAIDVGALSIPRTLYAVVYTNPADWSGWLTLVVMALVYLLWTWLALRLSAWTMQSRQ